MTGRPSMVGIAGSVLSAAFLALAVPMWTAAEEPPKRIVSLNLCADELVVRLAGREAIQSLTWLARDPAVSSVSDQVEGIPVNYGKAAEIVSLRPDLVLVGAYTTPAAITLLRRLETPLLVLDTPGSLEDVFTQISEVAEAVGEPERGRELIDRMRRDLEALGPPPDPPPVAAVYRPGGGTVGRGSLIDEILARAGFRNLAAELGMARYDELPLEVLLHERPEVVILSVSDVRGPSLAHGRLDHHALRQARHDFRIVKMPPALWTCAGPGVVEAAARLRAVSEAAAAPELEP